ncbi:alpha/beta fold hydrolase [Crocinitomix catalasitica]|uniref:alpha/beta fold hydrolase n=1 Tax=Crocinitomix catalasitica TaxID=184607 RepID=UPI00055A137D|nr:alpha/beta hydrolase [Crocinitomix catalasitica]
MSKFKYIVYLFFLGIISVNCKSGLSESDSNNAYLDELINANPDSLTYNELYDRAMSLWPVDFEGKNIQTKYGIAHVIISGPENGEPLVLLHGLNSSSTMWYPNIESLAKEYRVYAIDFLLEPSKSTRKDALITMDNALEWYAIVFDQLNLDQFALVGMSRGGWNAVSIALEMKDRITKLALLSPAKTFTMIDPSLDLGKNISYTLTPERDELREVLQTMTNNVDKIEQLYIDQYYRATTMWKVDELFLTMQPYNLFEWRKLKMPILLLIGDDDMINSERSIRQAKRKIKNLTTGIIPKSGHFLTMDQPAIVNDYLLDFLK